MSYLNKNGLNEAIVLIKYLGVSHTVKVSQAELNSALGNVQGKIDYWKQKALLHPEFFIVLNDKVSLFTRESNHEPLTLVQINELVRMAISLQQAEIYRKQRNSWLVPILIACISSVITLFTIFYKAKNNSINQTIISNKLSKLIQEQSIIKESQSELLKNHNEILENQDSIIQILLK